MTPEQIMDRYPWLSGEDAKEIAHRATIAVTLRGVLFLTGSRLMRQQQFIYEEAMRLKPS